MCEPTRGDLLAHTAIEVIAAGGLRWWTRSGVGVRAEQSPRANSDPFRAWLGPLGMLYGPVEPDDRMSDSSPVLNRPAVRKPPAAAMGGSAS